MIFRESARSAWNSPAASVVPRCIGPAARGVPCKRGTVPATSGRRPGAGRCRRWWGTKIITCASV